MNQPEEPKRLAPKEETIKLLLLRSGNECAFPGCNKHLFNDQNILVGECCHIESALRGGERFNEQQTNEERRSYENLLFLCHEHHIETDDEIKFPTTILKNYKKQHELKFSEKPFEIKPGYIEQVLSDFRELKNIAEENLEISKSIVEGQRTMIGLLQGNQSQETEKIIAPQFSIPAQTNFIGRKRELQALKEGLESFSTILVSGISGVGKTSLLVTALQNKSKILWIDCGAIDRSVLLYSIGVHLSEKYQRDELLKNLRSAPSNFEVNLSLASKLIEETGLCIVLDNINDRLSEFVDLIKDFNRIFKNAKIVFTSNSDISSYILHNKHFSLTLSGLDLSDASDLLKVSSESKEMIGKDLSQSLFALTNGHPYMIKLVAVLCRQIPLKLLLNEFKDLPASEVNEFIKKKIFNSLTHAEQEILIALSALWVPFKLTSLKFFSDEKDSLKVFSQIVDKYLITLQNKSTGTYLLHDLIRKFIQSFISKDKAAEVNSKAIKYLESLKLKNPIEWGNLIELSLQNNDVQTARQAAYTYLSNLMASGDFQLAKSVAVRLKNDPKTQKWDFIYYVIGRVSRFEGDFSNAVDAYETGIAYASVSFKEVLLFELAAVLFNLSELTKDNKLYQRSIKIYQELRHSKDPETISKVYGSIGTIKMRKGDYDEALADLEEALNILKQDDNPEADYASIYQIMGDCFSKKQEYPKALEYYSLSLKEYDKNKEIWRANVHEGVYYLYSGMGWVYHKQHAYDVAAIYFHLALRNATLYKITRKIERSWFDYSYNLLLSGEFEVAADNLARHYEMIIKNNAMRNWDPDLVFGALAMANWYAGRVTIALSFIGVLVNYLEKNDRPILIEFVYENERDKKVDIFEFFKKQNYKFLLNKEYEANDLRLWIDELIVHRPDLKLAFEHLTLH